MKQKIYDENLLRNNTADGNVDWYEVAPDTFDIYGVVSENDGVLSRRIPLRIAKTVSEGIVGQSGYGAGGRILFSTDAVEISVRAEYGNGAVPTVCNQCFSYGFDLYKYDGKREIFVAAYRPVNLDFIKTEFMQKTRSGGEMTEYTLNFPHFSEVKKLYIGLNKGSRLERGRKYINEKPVVFYGSSITHGAAAGRPGNTYENFFAQKYNADYINLGFAGNAKGEKEMAEYIAGLDMSVFVCDYDHNSPLEQFKERHYAFYEIIRNANPDLPYIMVSKPDFFTDPENNTKKRDVILETLRKAKEKGDENIYFIDGEHLFDGEYYESCTSDGCHPNDIGFLRMANHIGGMVAKVMGIYREEL